LTLQAVVLVNNEAAMTQKILIGFAALTATMLLAGVPAQAANEYPWCAYYGSLGMGATNCGFSTQAQCRAAISGVGGFCQTNPRYQPPRSKTRRSVQGN
jgi:hypothetical protein